MMFGHPFFTCLTFTIFTFIKFSNPDVPPTKVLCVDEKCSKIISKARVTKTMPCFGGDLKKVDAGKHVEVFAKNIEEKNTLWGIQLEGLRCFLDKSFLKEKGKEFAKPSKVVINPLTPAPVDKDDTEAGEETLNAKEAVSSGKQKTETQPSKVTHKDGRTVAKNNIASKDQSDETESEETKADTQPGSSTPKEQESVETNQQPASPLPNDGASTGSGESRTSSDREAAETPKTDTAQPEVPGQVFRKVKVKPAVTTGKEPTPESGTTAPPDVTEEPKDSSISPKKIAPEGRQGIDKGTPEASPTVDPWLSSTRSELLQCIRRLSDRSYLLMGLLHFVEVMRLPGAAIVALLPKSTVQALDAGLAFTGLSLELLIVSALCFLYLLVLSVLFQCCLCRRDFKADLSKRADVIASLEDKIGERDQVNAKLSESNVALTKKVKELERTAQEGRKRLERDTEDLETERTDLEQRLTKALGELEGLEAEKAELLEQKTRELGEQREAMVRAAAESEGQVQAKEEEIQRLKDLSGDLQENQKRLMEQTNSYYESMTQMQQEAEKIASDRDRLEQSLVAKDNEMTELRQSFQYLKALEAVVEEEVQKEFVSLNAAVNATKQRKQTAENDTKKDDEDDEDDDEDEDEDDEDEEEDEDEDESEDEANEEEKRKLETRRVEIQNQKLAEFLNVSQMRSEMQKVQERCQGLENKLRVEEEGRADLELRLEEVKRQNTALQTSRLEAEERQKVAQNKLDILSQYFKEREAEMQRNMGEQEILKNQSANQLETHRSRAEMLQEQTAESRRRLEEMQQELQEQERSMRRQISELEKRAFDNWKASRAAEREVKELKEENLSLRQRLVEADRARAAANAGPPTRSGPLAASSPPPFIPPPPPPPMPFMMRPPPFPPSTATDGARPTSRQSGGNESELSRGALDARPPSRSSASQSMPSGAPMPPMPPFMPPPMGLPPGMRLPPPPNFPPMGPGMMPPPPFMPPPRPPPPQANNGSSRPPR